MIGTIKRFFCPHSWEVVLGEKFSSYQDKKTKHSFSGFVLVQRCKKCGKVQKNIIKYG